MWREFGQSLPQCHARTSHTHGCVCKSHTFQIDACELYFISRFLLSRLSSNRHRLCICSWLSESDREPWHGGGGGVVRCVNYYTLNQICIRTYLFIYIIHRNQWEYITRIDGAHSEIGREWVKERASRVLYFIFFRICTNAERYAHVWREGEILWPFVFDLIFYSNIFFSLLSFASSVRSCVYVNINIRDFPIFCFDFRRFTF